MSPRQIALTLGICLAACGAPPAPPAPPTPAAPPPARQLTRAMRLQWLPDGSAILAGGRWRLDLASGRFAELPGDPEQPIALSPAGRVARVGDRAIEILGARGRTVPLKPWVRGTDGRALSAEDLRVAAYWIDAEHLYVHQMTRQPGAADCRIVDAGTGQLSAAPGGCLRGDFPTLVRIERGPGDQVALHSRGRHPAVRLARYDSVQGQRPLQGAPRFDLAPGGPLEAFFSPDGARVTLITPCRLEAGPAMKPCAGLPSQGRHGLYTLRLEGGTISKRQALVPPGTAVSPGGKRLAWIRNDQLCVGRPGGTTRCLGPPR